MLFWCWDLRSLISVIWFPLIVLSSSLCSFLSSSIRSLASWSFLLIESFTSFAELSTYILSSLFSFLSCLMTSFKSITFWFSPSKPIFSYFFSFWLVSSCFSISRIRSCKLSLEVRSSYNWDLRLSISEISSAFLDWCFYFLRRRSSENLDWSALISALID